MDTQELEKLIAEECVISVPPAIKSLTAELRARYGDSVDAVLFYGSCLRSGDHYEGLVDLYVVVNRYRVAYRKTWLSVLNWLLPPNVFYLETECEGSTVRSKYAIVSMGDFRRGTSRRWFHSYLWGRFAQPAGIAYLRDDATGKLIIQSMARAIITFVTRVLPHMRESVTTSRLWQDGLQLSYHAELRVEKAGRTTGIYENAEEYYERITPIAVKKLPYPVHIFPDEQPVRYQALISRPARFLNHAGWLVRKVQGKLLSVLRLLKAFFTFQGGLDYIAWKLERHSGEKIDIPERVRRYPLIFAWGHFWRIYRRGIFR